MKKTTSNNFQEQLQDPKWCEKQVKRLLSKGFKFLTILLFFIYALPVSGLILFMVLAITIENPTISTYELLSLLLRFHLIFLPVDFFFLYCFLNALFPLKMKNGRRIAAWGDSQEIYRAICMELLDEAHLPKKTVQVWISPNFILISPHFFPKLYYLPCLAGKKANPWEIDTLCFSDGGKIPLSIIKPCNRKLIEEAIADYF